MPRSLGHLENHVLSRDLATAVVNERAPISVVIEHMAEFDGRRLFAKAGFRSMQVYCVEHLGYSEDAAGKRIQAARAARSFPAIFNALEDGRLHRSAVCRLSPHLSPSIAEDLIAAAAHKSKAQIVLMLASRFPQADVETRLEPIGQTITHRQIVPPPPADLSEEHAPGHVVKISASAANVEGEIDSGLFAASNVVPNVQPTPAPTPRPRITLLAPQRFALQVTLGQSAHD